VTAQGDFKGCGTIEFDSVEAAQKAVALDGSDVMGRAVKVGFSHKNNPNAPRERAPRDRAPREHVPVEKTPGCKSIFLGNLSFDIDDAKVHEIFGGFGTIIAIRWVEREGRFTGCGFVEFGETEATDAAIKLNGTDILGRAVRVDFAADKTRKRY